MCRRMALGKWAAGSRTAAEEQKCLVKNFVRFYFVSPSAAEHLKMGNSKELCVHVLRLSSCTTINAKGKLRLRVKSTA